MTTTCPECESPITIEAPGDLRLSELLECADCRCELEVIALEPFALAVAPDPEEDWGE
jgi:alpha-aminoadipate/glutamate carrier protein LysW